MPQNFLANGNRLVEGKAIGNCRFKCHIFYMGINPESNLFQALNHFVIIAKYHIHLSWLNKASPSLLLNEKILCERLIAFKNSTLTKFRAKWTTVCMSCTKYLCLRGCATPTSIFFYVLLLLISFFCCLKQNAEYPIGTASNVY